MQNDATRAIICTHFLKENKDRSGRDYQDQSNTSHFRLLLVYASIISLEMYYCPLVQIQCQNIAINTFRPTYHSLLVLITSFGFFNIPMK